MGGGGVLVGLGTSEEGIFATHMECIRVVVFTVEQLYAFVENY